MKTELLEAFIPSRISMITTIDTPKYNESGDYQIGFFFIDLPTYGALCLFIIGTTKYGSHIHFDLPPSGIFIPTLTNKQNIFIFTGGSLILESLRSRSTNPKIEVMFPPCNFLELMVAFDLPKTVVLL